MTKPTEALVGEAGPEAVIPLDRFFGRESGKRGGETGFVTDMGGMASGSRETAGADESGDVARVVEAIEELISTVEGKDGDVYLDSEKVGDVLDDADRKYGRRREVR